MNSLGCEGCEGSRGSEVRMKCGGEFLQEVLGLLLKVLGGSGGELLMEVNAARWIRGGGTRGW